MKKVLVLLLCITMTFCFIGCGSTTAGNEAEADQTDTISAIPLGNDLGSVDVSGSCYGSYVETTVAEDFYYENDNEQHLYTSTTGDTPYITVYRWEMGDKSFEEWAQSESEEYAYGKYKTGDPREILGIDGGDNLAYYLTYADMDTGFFYVYSYLIEDGDEICEIDFYAKTVEIQVGDTDKYLWLESGYEDCLTDDEAARGVFLYASYDDDYLCPSYWATKKAASYEDEEYDWSYYWGDTLPFSEEEYSSWVAAGWPEDAQNEYYEALGFEVLYNYAGEYDDVSAHGNVISFTEDGEQKIYEDIYIDIDGETYCIWIIGMPEGATSFGEVTLTSIHTKTEN